MTKDSLVFIVSVLVNGRIEAEANNKNGINDEYIEATNKALEELKQVIEE